MTAVLTIEPFTWAGDLPSDDVALMTEIFNQVWSEWWDGDRPLSAEGFVDVDRFTHHPEVITRRLARDARGDVVGFGQTEWRDGEPGACLAKIFVAPTRRREGVATALGAELARVARDHGRVGMTVEAVEGSSIGSVLERAGFHADMTVEQNVALVAHAADDLLARWVAEGEAAAGYSLVQYDAPCPGGLAQDFVAARHVMNDAPRFEGEADASFTVPELRAAEASCTAAHMDWWSVGVRHDATGELIGLSELYLPRAQPWIAYQGDTGVSPAHRGHGLGAWMKAVNHLRLRAERSVIEMVQTWNAAANAPMLRINRALGFRPVQTYRGWYLSFE